MVTSGDAWVPRKHGRPRPRPEPLATLGYLARHYFHQDYDLEASDPAGVVRVFAQEAGDEAVGSLRREVVQLLAEARDEDELEHVWRTRFGASYEPRRHDGLSYREWFEVVVAVLDGRHRDGPWPPRGLGGDGRRPGHRRPDERPRAHGEVRR
ncbi:contact-dependent growth inhibition system immunity protein [Cellulomonas telluris]|uniref:contact-dependent growth inhibition system immunity protein n=1 Tax=Cellulomonas telluris TaxID=2306636 RepID=UPI0010A94624|nr:contact-dependent growth inhibition system immunity protein [Cellulomonas telluris]